MDVENQVVVGKARQPFHNRLSVEVKMRIGLALSGGGFRATLYHLGIVRCLRDAELLSQVSHVTAVSGGSVLAAHLAINWDRYCGSPEDFDAAAGEVLRFTSLDVRNRIVRRYPGMLAFAIWRRITLRRNPRLLTRTGLLESYYRKHLVGNTCLHQLPASPEVHILSTNVSEGGFSSFTREQLLIQQRTSEGRHDVTSQRAGLARLSTAVAASSAFPAFFPPLELRAADIGASEGEFPTQFFSDGGIFDNLGLRVFHFLANRRRTSLDQNDFSDEVAAIGAWNACVEPRDRTALSRLTELARGSEQQPAVVTMDNLHHPSGMHSQLNRLLEQDERLRDAELLALFRQGATDSNRPVEQQKSDGNAPPTGRAVIAEAFRQATGRECLRQRDGICDVVLASDAGKKFAAGARDPTPGFLSTALRASDILMDRVWQLERDNFTGSRYLFAAMSDIVPNESDPTALHPEIQVQVSRIRTDMDRFTKEEISGLIRHGYCVARHALRSAGSGLVDRMPTGPPWDPTDDPGGGKSFATKGSRGMEDVTAAARILQRGSRRRLWSSLLDLRDWLTWIYMPLIGLVLAKP